jgi:Protein of unknown function (DUF2510)
VTTLGPSGFYPDPTSGGRLRYWDGSAWTDRFQDGLPGFYPDSTNGGRLRYWDGAAWTDRFQDGRSNGQVTYSPPFQRATNKPAFWQRKVFIIPAVLGGLVVLGNIRSGQRSDEPTSSATVLAATVTPTTVATPAAVRSQVTVPWDDRRIRFAQMCGTNPRM